MPVCSKSQNWVIISSSNLVRFGVLPTLIDWYTCMSLPFTDDPVITFLLSGAVDFISKGHSPSFELKDFIIEGKNPKSFWMGENRS
jgi:hypothetical protein